MIEMPSTHLLVQKEFLQHAAAEQQKLNEQLAVAVQWREKALATLHRITCEFLLTGIVELPQDSLTDYHAPNIFRQRRPFSWMRYVQELAKREHRPCVYVVWRSAGSWNSATVIIQKQVYTEPIVARFLLLGGHLIRSNTRRWSFLIPNDVEEMIPHWRADCATDPVLRKALRLAPEYRPAWKE